MEARGRKHADMRSYQFLTVCGRYSRTRTPKPIASRYTRKSPEMLCSADPREIVTDLVVKRLVCLLYAWFCFQSIAFRHDRTVTVTV